MTKSAHLGAFNRLRDELARLADQHEHCAVTYSSPTSVLMEMGERGSDSSLEAMVGSYEVKLPHGFGLDFEALRTDRDVDRALAICDAIVAGRGVSVLGPNLYPSRTWFFLSSRGFKEAITTTAVSVWSCRRARSIPKSQWRRERLPDFTVKAA
jgi:hypothetical protein